MKKFPWGIIVGICAISIFYLTSAIIIGFLVLNAIAGQTNVTASLFDNWWQILIFILDILFVIAFSISSIIFFRNKRNIRISKEDKKNENF